LLGEAEGTFDRKEWIDRRVKELAGIFAVSVGISRGVVASG
jgi:hypothetical protein